MIMTMHTGVSGYRLAMGEVQPVLDSLTARLGFKFHDLVLRDVPPVDGAPNLVVAADVTSDCGGDGDYPMVLAYSGPISHAADICDALAHMEAGRNEPMCPRALKTINDFKRLAQVTSTKPALNMVWAVTVPEQAIYWLVAAVRSPNPNVMAFTIEASTPR
jgi:hypothetical protein